MGASAGPLGALAGGILGAGLGGYMGGKILDPESLLINKKVNGSIVKLPKP